MVTHSSPFHGTGSAFDVFRVPQDKFELKIATPSHGFILVCNQLNPEANYD